MVDPKLQRLIDGVTAKRPRVVLDHIQKHGYITTAELKERYGYNHPPRAARDVRELGIPLETFQANGPDGRKIAAYRLGDPKDANPGKVGGRRAFPKALKKALVEHHGERCALCGWQFPARALQIDHRVPYEVAGDVADFDDPNAYMLVCGSCNRAKSWTCETCENWTTRKKVSTCKKCMWGSPERYTHVAMEKRRTLTISWQNKDVAIYDRLKKTASKKKLDVADYAREILKRALD